MHLDGTNRSIRRARSSVVLTCLLCIAHAHVVACSAIKEHIQSQIDDNANQPPAGGAPHDTPVIKNISINAVRPNQGEVAGGTVVDLVGIGFAENSVVAFGDSVATDVHLIDATTLRVITPPHPQPTAVGVTVLAHPGAGEADRITADGAFVYFEPVRITRVEPTSVPVRGGTLVAVFGAGLVEGTQARLDEFNIDHVLHIDANTIAFRTPPLSRGSHTLTVSNVHGETALAGAVIAYEPVFLDTVTPFAVPNDRTTTLTARGSGFGDGTTWTLQPFQAGDTGSSGAIALQVTEHNVQQTQLTATLTAAQPTPLAEGVWHARVHNAWGDSERRGALALYDPNHPALRIIGTTPRAAKVGEEVVVTLAVGGVATNDAFLADPHVVPSVEIGSAVGQGCFLRDVAMITCTLQAPLSESVADITITLGAASATLPDGFAFLDARVDGITPRRVAMAGGTWVRVQGHGFAADAQVFVNDLPATDVVVEDEQHLTFATPPGEAGEAALRIETQGMNVRMADALTYFDPINTVQRTWGDGVAGAVNVTVVDDRLQRIAGAYVILDHANSAYRGLTNERGQITFSGPDITGPVAVHAGKPTYGAFSFIGIDAENLTLGLTAPFAPAPEPLPECPSRPSGGPVLIEGTVRRIKDEFNTGRDRVMVTTTQADLDTPLPAAGAKAQLTSQGPYALWARAGDVHVIGMAGETDGDGRFVPHALGFAPFITTHASSATRCRDDNDCREGERCRQSTQAMACTRVYQADIVIDTALDRTLALQLDHPPLGDAPDRPQSGTDTSGASLWYDFSQWGVLTLYPRLTAPMSDVLYAAMPRALPASLGRVRVHVRGGVYRGGNFATPYSETSVDNVESTSLPVALSPLLHVPLMPEAVPKSDGSMAYSFVNHPTGTPDTFATAQFHGMYDVESYVPCRGAIPLDRAVVRWYVITAPNITTFTLPRFPDVATQANLPSGMHFWQLMRVHTPNVRLNYLSLRDLFAAKSTALNIALFAVPQVTSVPQRAANAGSNP